MIKYLRAFLNLSETLNKNSNKEVIKKDELNGYYKLIDRLAKVLNDLNLTLKNLKTELNQALNLEVINSQLHEIDRLFSKLTWFLDQLQELIKKLVPSCSAHKFRHYTLPVETCIEDNNSFTSTIRQMVNIFIALNILLPSNSDLTKSVKRAKLCAEYIGKIEYNLDTLFTNLTLQSRTPLDTVSFLQEVDVYLFYLHQNCQWIEDTLSRLTAFTSRYN